MLSKHTLTKVMELYHHTINIFIECYLQNPEMVHLSYKRKITDKELSRYCDAGAKGERKYSSYSFLSSVLDEGEWPASRLRPLFARGKGPPVHVQSCLLGYTAV
jgi:hypothetical protein